MATPEFRTRPRALLAHALLGGVLVIIVGLPLVAAWRRQPPAIEGLSTLALFSGQLVLAAFLVVRYSLQQRESLRVFVALPLGSWSRRLGRGVRLGLVGWLLTVTAMALLRVLVGGARIEPDEGFADFMVWMATRPLLLRVVLILSAMTLEEVFFRAFLQPRIGLGLATLCFALGHVGYGSPAMGAGVLVIGLLLGLEFRRHADIAVCAVAHGVFDAIQLLVILPLAARFL